MVSVVESGHQGAWHIKRGDGTEGREGAGGGRDRGKWQEKHLRLCITRMVYTRTGAQEPGERKGGAVGSAI